MKEDITMAKLLKTTFTLFLALAFVFSFTSCKKEKAESSSATSSGNVSEAWIWEGPDYETLKENPGKAEITISNPTGVLAKVIDSGELIIGTSPDYPAAEFVDAATGEVMGCEILLAQYIANSLGVELKIETMDFSAVLTALDTGKIDLAISGFGYKEDRAEQYELSHGYEAQSSVSHHTLVVRADEIDQYNALSDLSGKKIDAQASSLQQMYVEDQIPNADLQLITSLDQGVLDLLADKIDAIALDATTAKNYAEASNGQLVSLYTEKEIEFDLSMYSDYAGNVCAAKKGETQFMEVINEIIDQVLATENYYEEYNLYATYYYAACEAAGISPEEE
ncbi:MAG: hypothetical protein DBY39_06755 [Clostridiales bacterium]|nr:MAG: hypothetical protein DBY39_06755 [Clostridiales bacterium]